MSEASPYQGLNLPELLERMHSLAMPDPISWLPQTDGWWVSLTWLALLVLLAVLKYLRHRAANRYRREALSTLQAIASAASPDAAAEVALIVKRTALSAYPRTEVAALYGQAWAEFLIRTGRNDPIIDTSAARLAAAAYTPDVRLDEILPCAERWIRRHA